MKFHCERCKTRYAIANERVRGKILKIRCKNCSAVITVREGMDQPALSPDRVASPADRGEPSESGPARAARDAIASNAEAPGERPGVVDSLAPIQPAHPTDRTAQWHISLGGKSNGPFSFEDARKWIAARDAEDELYCWRTGYDDWKMVEEVAHFRGLRSQLPIPDFAAIDSVSPTDEVLAKPTLEAPAFSPSPAAQMSAAPSASHSVPDQPDALHDLEDTSEPLFDDETDEAPVFASEPLFVDDVRSPVGVNSGSGPAAATVDAPRPPAGEALDSSQVGAGPAGKRGDMGGDGLDFEIGEPSRIVKLPMLTEQSGDDLATPTTRSGLSARRSGPVPGPGGTPGSLRGIGHATTIPGAAPVVTLGASATAGLASMRESAPLRSLGPEPRRRSIVPFILAALGVAGISAAVLAFFVISGDGGERGSGEARGNRASDFEQLGFRHESPTVRGSADKDDQRSARAKSNATGARSPNRRKNVSPTRRNQTRPAPSAAASNPNSTRRVDPTGDPTAATTPLTPDDVQRMATKNQSGFVRCYERAKRKDPFLEVKSMRVVLTVTAAGTVGSVTLSSHRNTALGSCIEASVGRWRFRPSRGGITTEIGLKFER